MKTKYFISSDKQTFTLFGKTDTDIKAQVAMIQSKQNITLTPATKEECDAFRFERDKPTPAQQYELDVTAWKADRQAQVDNIEVLHNEIIFQGDENSQGRMSRSINALPDDTTTANWVAKDNSEVPLTKPDLQAILFDAGQQQSAIWNVGRPVKPEGV